MKPGTEIAPLQFHDSSRHPNPRICSKRTPHITETPVAVYSLPDIIPIDQGHEYHINWESEEPVLGANAQWRK